MDTFFRTPMGAKFFESTVPRLVKAVESIAESPRDGWRCVAATQTRHGGVLLVFERPAPTAEKGATPS